jgi:hypothetical protein
MVVKRKRSTESRRIKRWKKNSRWTNRKRWIRIRRETGGNHRRNME